MMKKNKGEEGFSYMDVMIAITILLIGVLALTAAVTASVIQGRAGEQQLNAKQHAGSTLECIFSARDISVLGWESVGNIGTNPDENGVMRGIFVSGRQPIKPDDGADNIVGTADDTGTPISGFERQITITDICDPDRPSPNCSPSGIFNVMTRRVEITIYYVTPTGWRQEKSSTIVTNSLVNQ